MRGEEFGGCVLMTSSLFLENRLSSFLLLHRHVTAVILWHFKLHALEAQNHLAVVQLGEGFSLRNCGSKPLDVFAGSEKTNTKWHRLKVTDNGTIGCLHLYKGKSRVTVCVFFSI